MPCVMPLTLITIAGFSPPILLRRPGRGFATAFWTFRHIGRSDPWHVQWRRFLAAANFSGFIINRGVYALLVTFVAAAAREPVLAVFAEVPWRA